MLLPVEFVVWEPPGLIVIEGLQVVMRLGNSCKGRVTLVDVNWQGHL